MIAMNAGDAATTSAASLALRARDAFDEEELIDAVAEHAEPEQRERSCVRGGSGARPRSTIAHEQRRRERDAHAVVGERIDERRAELHDAEVDAPDERHRDERQVGQPNARSRRCDVARPGVTVSPAVEPMCEK